ncbi:hypothetical protein GH733_014505 [Mirounga leonina]|nr:hypothetical protein GH733_014505 [Mirounga leonina]
MLVFSYPSGHPFLLILWNSKLKQASLCVLRKLSMFYLLKIANISHPFFLWLKLKINRVVLGIFLMSFLTCIIISVSLNEDFWDPFKGNHKENITWEFKVSKIPSAFKLVILNLEAIIPFVLCLTSFLLLFFSLFKHTKQMKLNATGSRDPSTEAHMRDIKAVIIFLLLFIMYYAVFLVVTSSLLIPQGKLVVMFGGVIAVIFPSSHLFILIMRNSKLREAFLKVLRIVKSFHRRRKPFLSTEDNIFVIIVTGEFIIGMLGNVYIGLVNWIDWIKKKKISSIDYILTTTTPNYDYEFHKIINHKRNCTEMFHVSKSQYFNPLTLFNLLAIVPCTVSLISFFLLIMSLWRHIKQMKLSVTGCGDPSTEAHVRAMKTMTSFLFLLFVYYGASLLATFSYPMKESKLAVMLGEITAILYPSGNAFIGLVNCMGWIKNRKIASVDLILTSLAISRICLLCIILLDCFILVLYPDVYTTGKQMRIIDFFWTLTNHLSVWFATCLSIFYFLKIVNFFHPLFLWMKKRIDSVIPRILLGCLVLSVFISLFVTENLNDDFRYCVRTKKKTNLTVRCRVNKAQYASIKI